MSQPMMAVVALLGLLAAAARAQNPVQWNADVDRAVAFAREQSLPLLFWVSGQGGDDDDLEDAQEDCFRDPEVVGLIERRFVPVRVSRNSAVKEAAARHGLPTGHGLYCAVLSPEGRLLDQMGPGEVADPAAFALHLESASAAYCDALYEEKLRPLLEDLSSPKSKAREAAQTVYRLEIRRADAALVGLLERPDLTPTERSRLYSALSSLGTGACVAALLDRCDDRAAAAALMRAPPAALEFLLPELPGEEGQVTPRQLAAYRAAMRVCRRGAPRSDEWWATASAPDRAAEVQRLRDRAAAVMEFAAGRGAR